MTELIRSFIAIPLSNEIKQRVASFYEITNLCSQKSLRTVKPELLHLTLKFLGDTTPAVLEKVKQCLASISQKTAGFEIHLHGIGVFPGWSNPRVIWAGIEAPDNLLTLANIIETEMVSLGFESDTRGFSPHLTLARVNSRTGVIPDLQPLKRIPEPQFGSMTVSGVHLYRSELRPTGPIYTSLSSHPFLGIDL